MILDITKVDSTAREYNNKLPIDVMTTPLIMMVGWIESSDDSYAKTELLHAFLTAAYEAGQNNNKEEK